MTLMNALGVDLNNLKFDFERDWGVFQNSKIHKFLRFLLKKQLHDLHLRLESIGPDDLKTAQGELQALRRLSAVLERPQVTETLQEVLKFLENNYG